MFVICSFLGQFLFPSQYDSLQICGNSKDIHHVACVVHP
jgi:hypothetical protein